MESKAENIMNIRDFEKTFHLRQFEDKSSVEFDDSLEFVELIQRVAAIIKTGPVFDSRDKTINRYLDHKKDFSQNLKFIKLEQKWLLNLTFYYFSKLETFDQKNNFLSVIKIALTTIEIVSKYNVDPDKDKWRFNYRNLPEILDLILPVIRTKSYDPNFDVLEDQYLESFFKRIFLEEYIEEECPNDYRLVLYYRAKKDGIENFSFETLESIYPLNSNSEENTSADLQDGETDE